MNSTAIDLTSRTGARQFEALIIALVVLVGACLALRVWWLHPDPAVVAAGLLPTSQILSSPDMLYLLSPILGISAASAVFGIALIASGLSSSITGTLAGQIVMQGFLNIRVSRAQRALLTRSLAIVPAVIIAASFGTAGVSRLLVFSQVVLGLQLPFAVIPLLWFTTRRQHLGTHAFTLLTSSVLWSIAAALVLINA